MRDAHASMCSIMPTPQTRPLTPRQQRFVEEYLIDLVATQAAIRAGYSERAASSQGERLLRNAEIQAAIAAARAERSAKVKLDAQWVLDRLKSESEKEGEGSSHSARVRALELVGKHLGMFIDKIAPVNPDGQTPYLDRLALFQQRYAEIHPRADAGDEPDDPAHANGQATAVPRA